MNIFKSLRNILLVSVLAFAGSAFAGPKDVKNVNKWFKNKMEQVKLPVLQNPVFKDFKDKSLVMDILFSNSSCLMEAFKKLEQEKKTVCFLANMNFITKDEQFANKLNPCFEQFSTFLNIAVEEYSDKIYQEKSKQHNKCVEELKKKEEKQEDKNQYEPDEYISKIMQEKVDFDLAKEIQNGDFDPSTIKERPDTSNDKDKAIKLFKQLNPGQKIPTQKITGNESTKRGEHIQFMKNPQTTSQCGRCAIETSRWIAEYGGKTYEDLRKNLISKNFNSQMKKIREHVGVIAVAYFDTSLENIIEDKFFENMTLAQMFGMNRNAMSQKVNGVWITIIPACYGDKGNIRRSEKQIMALPIVKDVAKRFKNTSEKEVVIFNDGGHWSVFVILKKKNNKDLASVGVDSSSSVKRVRVRDAIIKAIQKA